MENFSGSENSLVLANRYLSSFQFSEEHHISSVKASASAILAAVKNYDERKDRVINFLQITREIPARVFAALGAKNDLANAPRFGLANFCQLEETRNEIAFGLIGRFWQIDYGLVEMGNADDFLNFATPGYGKLVMVWSVVPTVEDNYQLLTETRVFCPDKRSRFLFSLYWVAIRLASGLIRKRILTQLKLDAERRCSTAP